MTNFVSLILVFLIYQKAADTNLNKKERMLYNDNNETISMNSPKRLKRVKEERSLTQPENSQDSQNYDFFMDLIRLESKDNDTILCDSWDGDHFLVEFDEQLLSTFEDPNSNMSIDSDQHFSPISINTEHEYFEVDNIECSFSNLDSVVTPETYLGDVNHSENMVDIYSSLPLQLENCSKELSKSSILDYSNEVIKTALIFLNKMGQFAKRRYLKEFKETETLKIKYTLAVKNNYLRGEYDFTSLDKEILDLIFDEELREDKSLSLKFSETKYNRFVSIFDSLLFMKFKIFDEDKIIIMIFDEFNNIRKYYQYIPELLVLEKYALVKYTYFHIFCCLRSLNLIIFNCIKKKENLLYFKDKIITLISKIIKSVCHKERNFLDDYENVSVLANQCCKVGSKYFCIFMFYYVKATKCYPKNIKIKQKMEVAQTDIMLLNVKVISLVLIHKTLLLDISLDYRNYRKQKIECFIMFIQNNNCTNCIIKEFLDVFIIDEIFLGD